MVGIISPYIYYNNTALQKIAKVFKDNKVNDVYFIKTSIKTMNFNVQLS